MRKAAWIVGIGAGVVVIDFLDALRRHIKEKGHEGNAACKPWCVCKCNTGGCGCHNGPPPKPKAVRDV